MSKRRKGNIHNINTDCAEIIIESPKYGLFNAIIDLEDIDKCKKYTWHIHKNSTNNKFYARCYYKTLYGKETNISLHGFINNTPIGMQTDHINRDTLDNRKCNLRSCNIAENKQNQDAQKNNKSSGIKNIYWCKKQQKWRVALRINQVLKSFGRYDFLEDAIKVANKARLEYFAFAN